ncbi:MOSC domain-containing protein [Luedemannella helvata]|uniref:MOSC domain-containing protein n=1 Tax=Luedemannella helvata TaxID=349315 RepID=A0ABN2KWL3_9ACTN
MTEIVGLFRYPLKSARGESVQAVRVEENGLSGDRVWACLDPDDGTVASLKHPGRWGALLRVEVATVGGEVVLRVDGEPAVAGSAKADALLSSLVGRPVRLSRTGRPGARLHRRVPDEAGLIPDWMRHAAPGDDLVTTLDGPAFGGRFFDAAPVHLVSTGRLAALARQLGRDSVPVSRFRPNLVIDAADDPAPGTMLRVGDAVLAVTVPTPRCVVPGLGEGQVDRPLLKTLAAHRQEIRGLGRAACFGSYAHVLGGGELRVGQAVQVA